MTAGLGAMKNAKRKPRRAVMKAVGVTPNNTFKTFAIKFAKASGPLKGRPLKDPLPLEQVNVELKNALGLRMDTPYPRMLARAFGKKVVQ